MTSEQLAILAADIIVNNSVAPGTSGAIKNLAHNSDNAFAIAAWYNLLPVTDFWGNYKSVPILTIKGAIASKNYTPNDLPPVSGGTTQITNDLLVYLGRVMFAQTFQLSINNLLLASTSFDATNATLVSSLKDATNTDMPTGSAGGLQKGGWGGATGVQSILCRKGTNAEQLLAVKGAGGTSTDGSTNLKAATFTFEGSVTTQDVDGIWGI